VDALVDALVDAQVVVQVALPGQLVGGRLPEPARRDTLLKQADSRARAGGHRR